MAWSSGGLGHVCNSEGPSRSEPALCLGRTQGPFHGPAGSRYCRRALPAPPARRFRASGLGPQEGLGLLLSTPTRRENEGAPPTLKGALKAGLATNCWDTVWAQKSLYSCPRLWPRLALPPWAERPGPKVETSARRAWQLTHQSRLGFRQRGWKEGENAKASSPPALRQTCQCLPLGLCQTPNTAPANGESL